MGKRAKPKRRNTNKPPRYDNDQLGENVYDEFAEEYQDYEEDEEQNH